MRIGILKFHTFSTLWVCYVCILSYATSFLLYFLLLPYLGVWWCLLLLICWPKITPTLFSYMHELVTSITSYMFHIPSIVVHVSVTKHIARKAISLKKLGRWWYFCVTVINLNHSTSTSYCNMSKIMKYKTFNIIHQRNESFLTSMVRSKWIYLKTFFP